MNNAATDHSLDPTADQSAAVFAGARELIGIWSEHAATRLARPKCAALRALALSCSMDQFGECDLSRASVSAAALYLRHETRGKKLFAEGAGERPNLIELRRADTGEVAHTILIEPGAGEPAEEHLISATFEFLENWESAATRASWREIREQVTAALLKYEPCDARSRHTMRALACCLLTILRSGDRALRTQAAHTVLRALGGSIKALPEESTAPKVTSKGAFEEGFGGADDLDDGFDPDDFPAPEDFLDDPDPDPDDPDDSGPGGESGGGSGGGGSGAEFPREQNSVRPEPVEGRSHLDVSRHSIRPSTSSGRTAMERPGKSSELPPMSSPARTICRSRRPDPLRERARDESGGGGRAANQTHRPAGRRCYLLSSSAAPKPLRRRMAKSRSRIPSRAGESPNRHPPGRPGRRPRGPRSAPRAPVTGANRP